jgi:hypothetical protein
MHAYLTVKKQGDILVAQKSKSFVIAFPGLMARQWCQTTDTLDDTGSNSLSTDMAKHPFYCSVRGGYGLMDKRTESETFHMESDRLGVVIGSGSTAVAPNDYALGTQIRSGEKPGTILYCGTSIHSLSINATTDVGSFNVLGIFHNVSGGSIDVNEVGVYATGDTTGQGYPDIYGYCILRDTISTVALADEEFLEVEYTISIST